MNINELARIGKALQDIHEFSGTSYEEIINAWTGTVFSEEESWELKNYFKGDADE